MAWLRFVWSSPNLARQLQVPLNPRTGLLLHYHCTTIVLQYYYCTTLSTTAVLLLYYYGTTTVLLYYCCITTVVLHVLLLYRIRPQTWSIVEGSVGWRQKSSKWNFSVGSYLGVIGALVSSFWWSPKTVTAAPGTLKNLVLYYYCATTVLLLSYYCTTTVTIVLLYYCYYCYYCTLYWHTAVPYQASDLVDCGGVFK